MTWLWVLMVLLIIAVFYALYRVNKLFRSLDDSRLDRFELDEDDLL